MNDKWYRFNDSDVTVETESCVMKEAMSHSESNVYMLQYVNKDEFGSGDWGLSSVVKGDESMAANDDEDEQLDFGGNGVSIISLLYLLSRL